MDATFFSIYGSCKKLRNRSISRHLAGGRPTFTFTFSDSWSFARTASSPLPGAADFRGVKFEADVAAFARLVRRPLSGLEADFIWIALAVYFADRLAPRHPYGLNAPGFWRRRLIVRLPVAFPQVWQNAAEHLVHALEFLTEDDWEFDFLSNRAKLGAETQQYFPSLPIVESKWVSLFSGGLDSLAGALRWLGGIEGPGLLVSGQTHNRIAADQNSQVEAIHELFPKRVSNVGVK